MKRPLAWCCLATVLLLAVIHRQGKSAEESLLISAADLLAAESVGGRITIRGTVCHCSAASSGVRLSVSHLTLQKSDNSEQSLSPEIKITATTEEDGTAPGDRVKICGTFVPYETATNPGQFDLRRYYLGRGIIGYLRGAKVEEREHGSWSVFRMLYLLRRTLKNSFAQILEDRPARTIAAITLGEKSLMETEWKAVYQDGGIAHILAVSGLHVSLVGMTLFRLLRRMGLPAFAGALCSGAAVTLYALMTGAGVSALRAAWMFLIWLGSQIWGRKYDMVTSTAVAAAVILLGDGGALGESSFLLSFGAVLTIGILVPLVEKSCCVSSAAARSLLSGAVILLGTLPVTLSFFYQAAPWSILVNQVVLALMSSLMISGIVSALAGLLSLTAGIFLAAPVQYLLQLFEKLCRMEQLLPLPLWVAGRPSLLGILLYYGWMILTMIFTGREKRTGRRRMAWLLCAVLCLLTVRPESPRRMEILCLDVGQGDSSLIRFPSGETCLIDGGSSSENNVWENVIGQAAASYGVQTLDYVFLSHADHDHISGILSFLQEYEPGAGGRNARGITVGRLIIPPTDDPEDFDRLRILAAEKHIPVFRMERGGAVRSRGWSISCLGPDGDSLRGDRNEDSMVLMLRYGSFRMLFTGDLEGEAELALAAGEDDLGCDVLKAGHHGSAGATSLELRSAACPRMAVISCGRDNSYGHPSPQTLERLAQAGCQIFDTSKNGAIRISSDGKVFFAEKYIKF